ncbi:MAG: C-terminal helicase domain-containing protein [Candidatus Dormibacteria bacterium]
MEGVATVDVEAVSEESERRLVKEVIERVREGLSGRDGVDLVDLPPSRAIFAGVLLAPRQKDEDAAMKGAVVGDAPMGTAIGLDFRVKPTGSNAPVGLAVRARWAHYIPVFPSYQDVVEANTKDPTPSSDEPVVAPADAINAATEGDDGGSGDERTEGEPEAPDPSHGRVVLPRIWRRVEAGIAIPSVTLALGRRSSFTLGDSAIETELVRVQAVVKSEPAAWCHLGEIKARERALGDRSVLASADAYQDALNRRKSSPAAPPDWRARIQVETEPDPVLDGVWRVQLLLVNATPERPFDEVDPGLEERSIFDAGIELEVAGAKVTPFDFVLAPKDYRSDPQMPAKGINCAALWEEARPDRLATETLPVYAQPLYRTREALAVSFDALASDGAVSELERMADHMERYSVDWQDYLDSAGSGHLSEAGRAACKVDRAAFQSEVAAYRLGIDALRLDEPLLQAFRMMNRTFAVLGERSGGRLKAWRLFQIAFICSQLPSLAVRELSSTQDSAHAQQLRDRLSEVGVLWFPTGGGKTEAYLGLIATALIYDRLRGKTRGVTAWMRFPLRMLSLQQLDRLAKVVAALNELRSVESRLARGDPYAIGYYVGDNNTPNSVSEEDMRRYESNAGLRDEIKLVRQCPHCSGPVRIAADRTAWRLRHVCEDAKCFSNTAPSLGHSRGALPIYVTDTEIYRYLPSVLVGTVDKLAIIGRSRYFCHLIGGVQQQCPEHGYTSYDECIEHWNGCKRKRSGLVKLEPIRDPGPSLLIQDELHLLRDELGVFNGHYEGLLQYLCAAAYLPPKVLCATATIEAYDVQAFHIYLARACRFPQPGWLSGESFYATSSPRQHRRFYVGLFNHTRAIEDSALRVVALYQREIRRLRSDIANAATVIGAPEATSGAIARALRLHDLSVCYVNRKAVGGSIVEKLARTEQLLQRERLGGLRGVLLTGDQTIDEVGATLDRIECQLDETEEPRLDVLAATNLISHGVDLERINMMAVCGMPSHYAEYVQATSRSARSHPGVAFVCFNSKDPRERSQFEFFYPMHEHMERLIEAVAVNRFASHAPRKTVPGLLLGLLLNEYTPRLFGTAISKPLDHVPTLQGALGMSPSKAGPCIDQAALCATIEAIIGVDVVHPPASPAQIQHARTQVKVAYEDLMGSIGRTVENKLQDVIHPITSFRDVDEGIEFGSIDSASLITRMRAR